MFYSWIFILRLLSGLQKGKPPKDRLLRGLIPGQGSNDSKQSSINYYYESKFDYAGLYERLDSGSYHQSNITGNELAFLPLIDAVSVSWQNSHEVESWPEVIILGCGTCAALPNLQQVVFNHAYAMEVSGVSISIARDLHRDGGCREPPCIKQGSVVNIPWEASKFGVGLSCDVLEHIHPLDIDRAVQEITRTVYGILILSIPTGISVRQGIELHLTRQQPEWWSSKFQENGWVDLVVETKFWEKLWNRKTSPRLWNFRSRVCSETNHGKCAGLIMLARPGFLEVATNALNILKAKSEF